MRVLLTIGNRADMTELGPIPENVRVERWVPQDEVFREASLVICHGGSGTTFGALAAGLPLVIVPLFADQSSNGHRVADAGQASWSRRGTRRDRAERVGLPDAARITAAIRTVLSDPAYALPATRIAREAGRRACRGRSSGGSPRGTGIADTATAERLTGSPPTIGCNQEAIVPCTLTRPIPTTTS